MTILRLIASMLSTSVLAAAAGSAMAENLYSCAKGVVEVGDTSFEVSERCGAPDSKETVSAGGADVVVENWYYGNKPRIPYVFHFSAGKLDRIERLER